jgi:hypothetical protein
MSVLQIAKKHFATREPIRVTVEEWQDDAGQPTTIFIDKLNLMDVDNLRIMQSRVGEGAELMVLGIIAHVRDQEGKPLFTLEHKHELLNNVDGAILSRIGVLIFDQVNREIIKKN